MGWVNWVIENGPTTMSARPYIEYVTEIDRQLLASKN